MGPSVKFVSPDRGLISKKKWGTLGGWDPREIWQKTILFPNFFLRPSLSIEKIFAPELGFNLIFSVARS